MERYHTHSQGVSKCRWIGSGQIVSSDRSITFYSGHDSTHIHGVALIISMEKTNTLMEWEPISPWLIRARFSFKYCNLTILQCYVPTNETDPEVKDELHEQLQPVVSQVPRLDLLLSIGDFNAKVGADNINNERVMGIHACGEANDNGERLIDFCAINHCVIGGTVFLHKTVHKLTWHLMLKHLTKLTM